MNALTALHTKSEEAFADFALSIKARSGGSVTFKTAADIATKLTVGLFAHIYQQVEVMYVGEAARAMKIAEEYGQRLDAVADNLKDGSSLTRLVAGYPSHGFVIDMNEAEGLFKNVRPLAAMERELCDLLGHLARQQSMRGEHVYYMSDPPGAVGEAKEHDAEQNRQGSPTGQEQGVEGAAEEAASTLEAGETSAEVVRLPTGTERAG